MQINKFTKGGMDHLFTGETERKCIDYLHSLEESTLSVVVMVRTENIEYLDWPAPFENLELDDDGSDIVTVKTVYTFMGETPLAPGSFAGGGLDSYGKRKISCQIYHPHYGWLAEEEMRTFSRKKIREIRQKVRGF